MKPKRIEENGNVHYEDENGDFHREDGPALIIYKTEDLFIDEDGNYYREEIIEAEEEENDEEEKVNKIKIIIPKEDLKHEEWYIHGKRHREDGPAVKTSNYEEWYINDKLSRTDGPAITTIQEIGKTEEWFYEGRRHRADGPAYISPCSIEYYVEGELHRDGGPSMEFIEGDENGVGAGDKKYHLHGVSVSKELAEATDADFDRNWFFKEENVEIKREIIRKFGIERIFKVVDKKEKDLDVGECFMLDEEKENNYELIRGRLTESIFGTYLKMKNPSIGTFHLEGVPHEIKTVNEAIVWRNGGLKNRPIKLT